MFDDSLEQTCSLRCALYQHQTFNTQHTNTNTNIFPRMRTSSTPNIQHPTAKHKHIPSDAHFINTKHSTPNSQTQTCSLECALYQHLTFNTQQPSQHLHIIITQNSTPNTQHLTPNTQHWDKILCQTITSTYQPAP